MTYNKIQVVKSTAREWYKMSVEFVANLWNTLKLRCFATKYSYCETSHVFNTSLCVYDQNRSITNRVRVLSSRRINL